MTIDEHIRHETATVELHGGDIATLAAGLVALKLSDESRDVDRLHSKLVGIISLMLDTYNTD